MNDGADAFSENAEQGTDAVNDAMGAASSPADVSAVSGDASVPGSPVPTEGGSGGGDETAVPDDITELPETGGAPLAALGSGVLLMILGLTARRLARR